MKKDPSKKGRHPVIKTLGEFEVGETEVFLIEFLDREGVPVVDGRKWYSTAKGFRPSPRGFQWTEAEFRKARKALKRASEMFRSAMHGD